ncbi:hypothetical protein AZE42_06429 [Rhizopogon vesiculosus]|uniref:SEC7 domain-containing protein n=1 Tax=Rhizopogon vesiculosus TaxID=180088 RepID=A0A1J8Q378_9AGAM|nr:hypothetical protein AZE42_06429 [Rhizopogon vesiculosus]
MDNDPASVAEQRANAVAKLKRAASLPRLKNGRRPQMHNEVVSEGERTLHDDVQDLSQDTPSDRLSDVDPTSNVQPTDKPGTPEPSTVTRKRRSRSRSRSRGSKDFRKFKPPQSPLPTSITLSNDSSPDDSPPSPKEYLPHLPQSIIAPIPSHLNPLLPASPFILPGFFTAENSLLSSGTSSPVPGFPTLEALVSHQGLQRSNSAGAARMLTLQSTLQKLTGGAELVQSTFPSPAVSPQPFGKLVRNNTVSGGESIERSAARRVMMAQLNKRMIKETDIEEEDVRPFSPSSPSKRRQRRRSKRQSINPPAVSATDESDLLSTSNATPNRSNTPQTQPEPNVERTASTTPIPPIPIYPLATPSINLNETINSSRQSTPVRAVPPSHFDLASRKRRESVLIEDQDDEERIPPQSTYYGLPGAPSRPSPSISPRPPHSSDISTDFSPVDVTNVPVYPTSLERTPSRQARFPASPFARPHMEISLSSDQEEERDPDDEEVFPTEAFRRSPYHDGLNREISWVAEPVPETPMPVHEETDEEEDYEDEGEDEPLQEGPSRHIMEDEDDHPPPESPREEFCPRTEGSSLRTSFDSKILVVEASTSPLSTPVITSPTPSLVGNLPNTPSMVRGSDDLDSPQYPQRLSVAIRMHSDKSPVATEFDGNDIQLARAETPSSKREGSTWSKIVNTLTRSASSGGRRSRTNSIATRERRQNTDSSISRESGVSLPSPKTDKNDSISSATYPHGQPSSASTSVHSLVQPASTNCGVSSVPVTPSADTLTKYNHEKLNPFPGIKKLQEQWNHRQPLFSSTPDIPLLHHAEADIPLPSSSSSNTPSNSPEISRDRKLSHQASDTHLLHIYKTQAPPLSASVSTSSHDYFQHPSLHSPSSIMLRSLPTNRDGVRRWLSARKLFPQQPQSSAGNSPPTPVSEQKPAVALKKTSVSDLFRLRKENDELRDEWVDVDRDNTRVPAGSVVNGLLQKANGDLSPTSPNGVHDDLQKTPRASKIARPNGMSYSVTDTFLIPPTPATPSPPELPSSTTPEPWSSLSDYAQATTSESSSGASSHCSDYPTKGGMLLNRLNEMLGRGSRSPVWPSVIDEPPRRFLRGSPVFQVVNSNICKDRFLFLFNDILIIAKPRPEDSDTFLEVAKPNPADRKFTVKNVVLLRKLIFTSEREESCARAIPRTPAVQAFVERFSTDPDHAVASLFSTLGHRDDPAVLAQLLFKTSHIDRVQLGDYLSRRASRVVLKHYLDEFGFMGLRVDKALRLFLQSIHIPERGSHGVNPLDVLLESFANRWYEANAGHIAYDKDLAYRFARAIVQLNDVLHGAISHEPGQMGHPSRRHITARDFLEAFRRHDTRLSDDLLGDVYNSICRECLCQARNPSSGGPPEITVTFKRPLPPRLTYRVQSEPVVIRIPQPDPQFSIELFGHDLVFDPPVLSFAKSAEASFRVTGHSFGLKTMTMLRSSPNALLYTGLAQSYTIAVERAFMRNTFQVAFLDHNEEKRKYMFSVTDPVVRHEWAVSLKREIDASAAVADHPYGISWPSLQTARFYKASYNMAFKVLQDTLLNPSTVLGNSFPSKVDHALARLASSGLHTRDQSKVSLRPGMDRPLEPVRSKSRSRMYHRHGPGKMESEGNSLSFPHGQESSDDGGDDPDAQLRSEDQYWSGKDLVMYCQQNSSIALLLAYLQVGTPDLNGSQ